jgi:chromosome partitioning protein
VGTLQHSNISTPGTVIVLATGKGGVGKSTLVRSLAAHWLLAGRNPAVVDADPEHRVARRHDKTGAMAAIPVIADADEASIGPRIRDLKTKHGVVIVDTAGFRNKTQIMACIEADVVLIPMKPAPDDVDEAVAMHDLVQELNATPERHGRPIAAALVLTMVKRATVIARSVRRDFRKAGLPLLDVEIKERVAYPEAAILGQAPSISAPEGEAAFEIAALATQLEQLGDHHHVQAA